MSTVFSHIVQKRLSQKYENVATDALAFIVSQSEAARNGIMKLIRSVSADLPELRFRAQHSVEGARPDMCGFIGSSPRVYIENKFWAGLTDNQPVAYLKHLGGCAQPSLLLFVVPEARIETVWRELLKRLQASDIMATPHPASERTLCAVDTGAGPVLAITTWTRLLAVIEVELHEDPNARNDLLQLRALCDAADLNAFTPLTAEELTNQRTPALILHMHTVVKGAVDVAVENGVVSIKECRPQMNLERVGRYALFLTHAGTGFGAWFGLHYQLWKDHGGSPLWLVFHPTDWGRAAEARLALEPWCREHGLPSTYDNEFGCAVDLPQGEELEEVIDHVAGQLSQIRDALAAAEPVRG